MNGLSLRQWNVHALATVLGGGLLFNCLGGCDGPVSLPPAYVVRDSAGIEIVESVRPSWTDDEVWGVSTTPLLVIGGIDGAPEYQFTSITGLWRDNSGRIHVAERRSAEVRRFGQDGRYLGAIGRQGEGPGELPVVAFASPVRGDSILIASCCRMVVYGPDDRPARHTIMTMPMSWHHTVGQMGVTWPGYVVGVFDDGTMLVGAGAHLRGPPGTLVPTHLSYHLYTADGQPGDTIIELRGPDVRMMQEGYGLNPAEPYSLEVIRGVRGTRFYLGASRAFEFGEYSATGQLQRLIRATHLDLTLTTKHRDEYFEYERAVEGYAEYRQSYERAFTQIEFPETLPPYEELIVDTEDFVWIMHHAGQSPVGPTPWSVFSPAGILLGVVEMPAGFVPHQIGEDFVLGVWHDDLDVPYVRMYELTRGRGA